jgi:ribosomal protein S18 acetylase RimI-like enzyme
MNTINIRQAGFNDVELVSKIFNEYRVFYGCESDLKAAESFIYERIKNLESVIFIATDEQDKCMGFTQLYPLFSSVSMKKVYILNDLFVYPDYRRQNVASQLLTETVRLGKQFHAARITLTTEISNENAQKLYEKNGFSFDHENKVYHYYIK